MDDDAISFRQEPANGTGAVGDDAVLPSVKFFKLVNENFKSHTVVGDIHLANVDCIVQIYHVEEVLDMSSDTSLPTRVNVTAKHDDLAAFCWFPGCRFVSLAGLSVLQVCQSCLYLELPGPAARSRQVAHPVDASTMMNIDVWKQRSDFAITLVSSTKTSKLFSGLS